MFVLILILIVLALILYGWSQYLLDKFHSVPPGPFPLPFLGNLLLVTKRPRRHEVFAELSERYGPISTIYVGQTRFIILNGASEIHEAIVAKGKATSNRPQEFSPVYEGLPTAVLLGSGEKWQNLRRFTLRALRDFGMGKSQNLERIHEEMGFFLETLELEYSNKPFYPGNLLQNSVSNIISSILFGKRFEYGDDVFVNLMVDLKAIMLRSLGGDRSQIMIHCAPILRNFIRNTRIEDMEHFIDGVGNILQKSIAEHRQDFNPYAVRDFADIFIQLEMTESGIDFEHFATLAMDLFIAGTETTATLLNWSLLFMCLHPLIQRKCQSEIDRVVDNNRLPHENDRSELVYIDAVLCEVMRIVSIVPLAVTHCNGDHKIQFGKFVIPKRSFIVYNVWNVHNDPTYWENPQEFNPDRFIGENGELLRHNSHFMPFGVGPRACLGENLAKTESFIYFTSLMHRFKFSLVPGQNVDIRQSLPGVTHSPPFYQLLFSGR